MTETTFATPGTPSAGVDWTEHNGNLLLITVHAVETGIKTSFGDKDAVRADVVDLDDGNVEYSDTLIFPTVLIGQLRTRIGQKVLGRLGQGSAKPGQKPPWLLQAETTKDDTAKATAYLAGTVAAVDDSTPPF